MIKLLIADDEPLVCVGLQSMIKWEALDIEIIGTARNGQQAAEFVERLRPDIVITDSILKAIATAHNYFNVSIHAAVGHTVSNPRRLDESYFSAQRLLPKTIPEQPLLFFDTDSEEGRKLLLTLRRNYKQRVVSGVQEYIRNNLDKRLSLNEVAAVFHISPGYLSQLFAKHADEGFVEYITTARIEAAKEMLARGDGKIYEIAEHLGFESAFYFSKVFKKTVGVSPREYLQTLYIK